MARRARTGGRRLARNFTALETRLLGLRKKAAALRREERAAERAMERIIGRRTGRVTRLREGAAKRGGAAHGRPTGPRVSLAVALRRGGGGLFCGCPPIRIFPQPNDDLDICILVGCADGFCDYWCTTLVAPPIVGIARARRRRRR